MSNPNKVTSPQQSVSPVYTFQLNPSKRLALIWLVLFGGFLSLVILSPIHWLAKLVIVILLLTRVYFIWPKKIELSHPKAIVAIDLNPEQAQVIFKDGSVAEVQLKASTQVWNRWVGLDFSYQSTSRLTGFLTRGVAVFPDQMNEDQYRRFKVLVLEYFQKN